MAEARGEATQVAPTAVAASEGVARGEAVQAEEARVGVVQVVVARVVAVMGVAAQEVVGLEAGALAVGVLVEEAKEEGDSAGAGTASRHIAHSGCPL